MSEQRAQLQKILRLALGTPYPGEREKAVGLLVPRLRQTGLNLHDLDPTFPPGAQENELRERAGLCFHFEMTLNSAEEALLFLTLLRRLGPIGSEGKHTTGHQLQCFSDTATKERVIREVSRQRAELGVRLGVAQQQAQREYRLRRDELFHQAVLRLAGEVES